MTRLDDVDDARLGELRPNPFIFARNDREREETVYDRRNLDRVKNDLLSAENKLLKAVCNERFAIDHLRAQIAELAIENVHSGRLIADGAFRRVHLKTGNHSRDEQSAYLRPFRCRRETTTPRRRMSSERRPYSRLSANSRRSKMESRSFEFRRVPPSSNARLAPRAAA